MITQNTMKILTDFIYTDFKQKVRFALVGLVNTFVAYLAFIAIYQLSGRYILASVLSYFFGMLVSYVLNRSFVFKSKKNNNQFIPFAIVNLLSLGCSTGVLYILVDQLSIYVYLAQFFAICTSMVINYLGYKMVFTHGVSMIKAKEILYSNNKLDWFKVAQVVIALMFAVITVLNLRESVSGNVAHDALSYMDSYSEKFVSEGRWINFALFGILRTFPHIFAAILCNLFICIFAYNVCMGVKKDRWLAFCFALLAINTPFFTMLFKWPMTLITSTLLLAILSSIKDKYNRNVIVIVGGILLFASYPAFYFLVPLLYISSLSNEKFVGIIKFLAVWILGYVLGYLIANGMVYLYTSIALEHASFIHFVNWRESTPTNSLSSLVANIEKSAGNFKRAVLYISTFVPYIYIPLGLTILWAAKNHTKYVFIVLCVVFSLYASVIPLGVVAPLRSAVMITLGLAMFVLLVSSKWWRALLLVTLIIPFSHHMYQYNHKYNHTRNIVAKVLSAHDYEGYLHKPELFKKVIVSVDEQKMSDYMMKLTGSHSFANVTNLRLHYIKPYLNQYGWDNNNIEVINKQRESVTGQVKVMPKDHVLYVTID